MKTHLVAALAFALAAGCVHRPAPVPPAPPSSVLPVAAAAIPDAPLPAAAPTSPVYRPPKIARIYLRAHQDASGRLVGPQVIFQVIDPGGWNVDALDHVVPDEPQVIDPSATRFLTPDQSFQPTPVK